MSLNSTIFEGIALVAVAESAVSIMAPANDRMDQIGTESHEFVNIGCIFNGNIDRIGLEHDMLSGMFIFIFIFIFMLVFFSFFYFFLVYCFVVKCQMVLFWLLPF